MKFVPFAALAELHGMRSVCRHVELAPLEPRSFAIPWARRTRHRPPRPMGPKGRQRPSPRLEGPDTCVAEVPVELSRATWSPNPGGGGHVPDSAARREVTCGGDCDGHRSALDSAQSDR
jgi:hypothetical protein